MLGNTRGGARYAEDSGARYAEDSGARYAKDSGTANTKIPKLGAATCWHDRNKKKGRRHNPEAELVAGSSTG